MIKTIIFDWGGVLTIGKYTESILVTISKDKKIVMNKIYPVFEKLIIEMNSGNINFKEFVQRVEEKLSLGINENAMKEIFRNSIIPNKEVIQVVRHLSSQYDLRMLSDNDEVTVAHLKKYHKDMLSLFSKKYFSHELGLVKPNHRIFQHVLKDAGLISSECIFIDDQEKNTAAAARLGFKTILFSSTEKMISQLAEQGITI